VAELPLRDERALESEIRFDVTGRVRHDDLEGALGIRRPSKARIHLAEEPARLQIGRLACEPELERTSVLRQAIVEPPEAIVERPQGHDVLARLAGRVLVGAGAFEDFFPDPSRLFLLLVLARPARVRRDPLERESERALVFRLARRKLRGLTEELERLLGH